MLPFFVLYRVSDALYFIFYYLTGYRRKVVLQNIRNSFPEKTEKEHVQIMKKFYRHFCDLFVESLKIFTISRAQVRKRMIIKNPEEVDQYYEKGKGVILAGGHYNNWELFAVAIDESLKHHTVAIYKPLSNKFFDRKMRATRGKYGLDMVSTKAIKSIFEERKGALNATIFATDQSPSKAKSAYWMNFLNQDTGVLFGTEKYAREFNQPVLYGRILKVKRGHYVADFTTICEFPEEMPYGAITEKHTHLLEQDILRQPEFWLWSHRRWKHKRPADISQNLAV